MIQKTHGTIHGRTIQIADDLGLPDGEQVVLTIAQVESNMQPAWGEGIKRCAGAAANIPEFDAAFEQVSRDRQAATFRESSE